MKAYEFPATVTTDGDIEIPATLAELLPPNQQVRVIVLVPEAAPYETDLTPEQEDEAWATLGEESFLALYDESDAIYDQVYREVK
jgi:hypothetical protein